MYFLELTTAYEEKIFVNADTIVAVYRDVNLANVVVTSVESIRVHESPDEVMAKLHKVFEVP